MSEEKPSLQKPASGQEKPKSGGKGCLMAFVITVVVSIASIVFGGYYALFHSSLPLTLMAKAINDSGMMEIKGLKGSVSEGFSADEFRIFKTGLTDTYFTNISFQYNGMSDLSNNQRLIVEEFIIGKAFISLPEMEASASDGELEPRMEKIEKIESPEELEQTGSFEIKTFRIDEFVIQNPDGEEKSGSVLLSGFKADHNDMQIAELKVTGDYLEMNLETLPETNQFRQAIRGVVKAAIHQAIRKDIDFALEFGGVGNAKQGSFTMFDGQVQGRQTIEAMTTEYLGLTLSNYLDPSFVNLPDAITMKTVTAKDEQTTEISAGSFQIGQTKFKFADQTINERDPQEQVLVASAEIGERTITLQIPNVEASNRMKYEFASEGMDLPDMVAQVLFGKDTEDLSDEEKEKLAGFARNHMIPLEADSPEPTAVEPAKTNAPGKKE